MGRSSNRMGCAVHLSRRPVEEKNVKKKTLKDLVLESYPQRQPGDCIYVCPPNMTQEQIDRLGGRFFGMKIVRGQYVPEDIT